MFPSKDVLKSTKEYLEENESHASDLARNEYLNNFHRAVRENNLAECERFLANGADVNVLHKGKTALCIAAAKGLLEMVKILVDHNADLHHPDLTTKRPLMLALLNQQYEVMRYLISAGADVDITDTHMAGKKSCLYYAADLGIIEGMKILLDAGCDVNLPRSDTPLHRACQKGNVEAVQLLLQSGADANIPNFILQLTPLHVALVYKHTEIIRALLPFSKVDQSCRLWETPMHLAAEKCDVEVIDMLVEAGWSVNMTAKSGRPVAFCAKEPKALQALIRYGCDLNQVWQGKTLLHNKVAISKFSSPDRPALVKILLDGYCDPNIPTTDTRETALHLASKAGCLETIKLLLLYGAEYQTYDKYSRTPLIIAIQEGEKAIVELFARLGQKLNFKQLFTDRHFDFLKTIFPSEFCGWFLEEMLQPASLKCLSRDYIRHHLVTRDEYFPVKRELRFDARVNNLPLPQRMKDFIFMTVNV